MLVGVIGLGTAGVTFLSEILRQRKRFDIFVVERRGAKIFHPCSIPSALKGEIPVQNLEEPSPFNVKTIKGIAKKIYFDEKIVEIDEIGGTKRYNFDILFVGTGGDTKIDEDERNLKATTLHDVEKILEKVKVSKKVAVIGGGVLGLEIASSLKDKIEVEIFEAENKILPNFTKKLTDEIMDRINVKITFGKKVKREDVKDIGDFAIWCVGFKPNTEIFNGEKVFANDKNQLILGGKLFPYVYIGGDVLDYPGPKVAPMASYHAKKAVWNIIGLEKWTFSTPPPCLIKAFSLEIGKVGMNKEEIKEDVEEVYVEAKIMPFENARIKAVLTLKGEEILGGEAFVDEKFRAEVRHFLDILWIAIEKKIPISFLEDMLLSYQPEVCTFPDPITSIFKNVSIRLLRMRK